MSPSLPRGRKARKAATSALVSSNPAPSPMRGAFPLHAFAPGARAGLTVRGPGALEWLAFLEGRASR